MRFPDFPHLFNYSLVPTQDLDSPLIIAHRGGACLAPENTIEGWSYVRESFRPDVFELDLRVSADGHPVVIHDRWVDRTTDGQGRVDRLPLASLKKLDAGYRFTPDSGKTYPWRGTGVRIPTLVEILDSFPRDRFNIEVKKVTPGLALQLAAVLQDREMTSRVTVLSRDNNFLSRLNHLDSRINTAAVFSEKSVIARMAKPSMAPLVKSLIRRGRRRGIKLEIWTVNDPSVMEFLLRLGVDGLVTDRPDLALEVFKKLGLRRVAEKTCLPGIIDFPADPYPAKSPS